MEFHHRHLRHFKRIPQRSREQETQEEGGGRRWEEPRPILSESIPKSSNLDRFPAAQSMTGPAGVH